MQKILQKSFASEICQSLGFIFVCAATLACPTVAAAQGLVITANTGPPIDPTRVTTEELFCRGNSVAARRAVFSAVFSFTGKLNSSDTWRDLNDQWTEFLKSELNDPRVNASCSRHGVYPSGILYRDSAMRQWQGMGNQVSVVNWTPKDPAKETGSAVRRKAVFFRGPNPSLKENGYSGVTFDIEYKFLVCDQEVHIAYSILDDSVKSKDENPSYWFGPPGKILVYKPKVAFQKINSLPLKFSVWIGQQHYSPLARLSDVQASKALALTCFAGQTQKIAMLKDHVPKPTPAAITAFLNNLNASFETSMILTSSAAEQEIKAGQVGAARTSDADAPKQLQTTGELAAPPAADPEAKALNEANLAKVTATVAAATAKRRAEQAQYEQGVRLAAAAKAKYDQDKVAYDAQLVRVKAAQIEYQRKMVEYKRAIAPK